MIDIHSLQLNSHFRTISKSQLFSFPQSPFHLSTRSLTITIMAKTVAQSPLERSSMASLDHKLALAKRCSHEGVVAGAKAAVVATIATAIPTMTSARMLPWARANLNPTAQALIISTVAGAAYFIVADKTILASARRNSFNQPAASLTNNDNKNNIN